MANALGILLPRLVGKRVVDWKIVDHGSKHRLLKDLPSRFAGYAGRLAREDIRVLVIIDRDDDDCRHLKAKLEKIAADAGLSTKSAPDAKGGFRVVNRLVIEELEAWFLGDVPALCTAYPGVPMSLSRKKGFHQPDAISGGTWEKLLQVLQRAGHYRARERLPKNEVARRVAACMEPGRNCSPSFQHFLSGLEALLI
jgi:hypothetical protein